MFEGKRCFIVNTERLMAAWPRRRRWFAWKNKDTSAAAIAGRRSKEKKTKKDRTCRFALHGQGQLAASLSIARTNTVQSPPSFLISR